MRALAFALLFISILIEAQTNELKRNTSDVKKPSVDLNCQKIIAYYNGTFKNPTASGSFQLEFEVTIDINLNDKVIYFKVEHFNKKYSSQGYTCDTHQKERCSLPFEKLSLLGIWIQPFNNPRGYNPWLIYVDPISNNRFTLSNAIGNCANSLKNDLISDKDPSLYKSCFCCGDKYSPDSSLNCPISPWS